MRSTTCNILTFALILHVQMSFQQDNAHPPCSDKVLKAISDMEHRLEEKLSNLIINKMADLIENKLNNHEDKISQHINKKLTCLEERISESFIDSYLLDEKLYDNTCGSVEEFNNTLTGVNQCSKPKRKCRESEGRCINKDQDCPGSVLRNGCKERGCKCCVGLQDTPDEEVKAVTEGYQCEASSETPEGCLEADGFFKLPESEQCFKVFRNESLTWEHAEAKCKCHGLALTKPEDPLALRKYIVENIGSGSVWLGGRGGGESMMFVKDQSVLPNHSGLWRKYHPGDRVTSEWCLLLLTDTDWLRLYSYSPYAAYACTDRLYTLCEVPME